MLIRKILLLLVDYLTWRIENPSLEHHSMRIAAHGRLGKIRDLIEKL